MMADTPKDRGPVFSPVPISLDLGSVPRSCQEAEMAPGRWATHIQEDVQDDFTHALLHKPFSPAHVQAVASSYILRVLLTFIYPLTLPL